ncbi:MAG: aminocarboxymuconate-semialdehyde decarboxylase [Solirubrobacteraceae bacterium]
MSSSAPVIDVHAHGIVAAAMELVQGEDAFRAAREREAELVGAASAARQAEMIQEIAPLLADVERRVEAMDRAGVDIQLVSPSPAHYHDWAPATLARSVARAVNEGIASLCAQRPDRLIGLGLAPLQHPDVAETALVEAVSELGLRGVEISTAAPGRELSDPDYEAFWARAEELGALVFIHPWGCSLGARLDRHYLFNVVGQPVETTVALSHVIFSGLLDRRPKLRILAAHGGGYLPFYPARSDHAWRVRPEVSTPEHAPSSYLRRLYFDSLVHEPELLAALVERVGADRVLMGSDFPFDMGNPDPVAHVHATPGLDDAARAAICGATAAELLGLSASA